MEYFMRLDVFTKKWGPPSKDRIVSWQIEVFSHEVLLFVNCFRCMRVLKAFQDISVLFGSQHMFDFQVQKKFRGRVLEGVMVVREEDEGLYKITKKQKHSVKMTQQLTDGEIKEGQADDMFAKAVKSLLALSSDTNQDFVLCDDESPATPNPGHASAKPSIMLTKSGKLLADTTQSQPVAVPGVAQGSSGQDSGGRKAEDEDDDESCMRSGLLKAFGGSMNMNKTESLPKAKARTKAAAKNAATRKRKTPPEAIEGDQHQPQISVQDLEDDHGLNASSEGMPPPASVSKKGRVTQATLVENDERFADEIRSSLHQLVSPDVNPMPATNEADLVAFARSCQTRLRGCWSKGLRK